MKNFQFVVVISGLDLPGLLVTFTDCIKGLGYNIEDINLSTGGGLHSTFFTCLPAEEEALQTLPGRARQLLEDELTTAVRKKYEEWYDAEDRFKPDDWDDVFTVKVRLPESQATTSDVPNERDRIRLYVGIAVSHTSGIVYRLAKCFEEMFNITNATISDVMLSKKVVKKIVEDGTYTAESLTKLADQLDGFRVLWLTLVPTRNGADALAGAIGAGIANDKVVTFIEDMIATRFAAAEKVTAKLTTLYVDYGTKDAGEKRPAEQIKEFTEENFYWLLARPRADDEPTAVTAAGPGPTAPAG